MEADCQWSSWSAWSSCQVDGGWCHRHRDRYIRIPAVNGGEECNPNDRVDIQGCPYGQSYCYSGWYGPNIAANNFDRLLQSSTNVIIFDINRQVFLSSMIICLILWKIVFQNKYRTVNHILNWDIFATLRESCTWKNSMENRISFQWALSKRMNKRKYVWEAVIS